MDTVRTSKLGVRSSSLSSSNFVSSLGRALSSFIVSTVSTGSSFGTQVDELVLDLVKMMSLNKNITHMYNLLPNSYIFRGRSESNLQALFMNFSSCSSVSFCFFFQALKYHMIYCIFVFHEWSTVV